MPGLMNNLSSEDLALIASRLAGQPDLLTVDMNDVRSVRDPFGVDERVAQVCATLALVQAVRELRDEIHGAHAGHS
jgi:hypothetical protein